MLINLFQQLATDNGDAFRDASIIVKRKSTVLYKGIARNIDRQLLMNDLEIITNQKGTTVFVVK
jgi:hypothetical protein